ncbi:MAG: TIGR03619 family F420-dependent LLM class oxidoreductase [Pseudomonadales bacterium]|nr:TIGR03619 family F420-dependent LLM class oxidoreductase [Pseudomonadales bacterium]
MKIGTFAAFSSPQATPEIIEDFGRGAEDLGLDSVWVGEHVVLFDTMEFPYPGSRDGKIPMPENGGLLDTVATLAFLAGNTKALRLGTGITLLPQRNPIYTAKEFTTLDWLSGGRIDFGVGVGWCKEEVIACGYSWQDRGARCDEFLELLQTLWTEPIASYAGDHFTLQPCRMDPKPLQKPHIPIIIGGHSRAALRRAARFGNGWYGFGTDPHTTAAVLEQLDQALAARSRSRDNFEIIMTPPFRVSEDMVRQYRDLGVDRLVVQLGGQRPDSIAKRFGELEKLVAVAA